MQSYGWGRYLRIEAEAGFAEGLQHRFIYVPGEWRPTMCVIRHLPQTVFERLDIWLRCRPMPCAA